MDVFDVGVRYLLYRSINKGNLVWTFLVFMIKVTH